MGLLTDLRAAAPADAEENPWLTFKRVMPLFVPGLEVTKMETSNNGRIGARGRTPMQGKGRYYWVLTMDGVGAGREDGTRLARLGVSSYRDEADAMIYDRPFHAYVDPQPGAVAIWMAGVLLTEGVYSERRG